MRNWMKQLNRVIVLALALVCLFGCLAMKAEAGTWVAGGGSWWYDRGDGTWPASVWEEIDGQWYYFNSGGYCLVNGWQQVNGYYYYFASGGQLLTKAGGASTNGWIEVSGTWYYVNTSASDPDSGYGRRQTGWQKISGSWYYFDSGGKMLTGWQKISNNWYYLGTDGACYVGGWKQVDGYWYYFASGDDGKLLTQSGTSTNGWILDDGKYYLVNTDSSKKPSEGYGRMLTGWQKSGSNWYYFDSSGVMTTGDDENGWKKFGDYWYNFKGDGAMRTGWHQLKDSTNGTYWFYFQESGSNPPNGIGRMVSSTWVEDNTGWLYLDGDGKISYGNGLGWLDTGSGRYFVNSDGYLQTEYNTESGDPGWICLDRDKDSYFYVWPDGGDPNTTNYGKMQIGWKTIDGEKYYFCEDVNGYEDYHYGQMYHSSFVKFGEDWYHFGTTGAMNTEWYQDPGNPELGNYMDDDEYYYLGSDGIMRMGWYIDTEKNRTYFLNDGRFNDQYKLGQMISGWHYVDEKWYYFGGLHEGWVQESTITVTNTINGPHQSCSYTLSVWTNDGENEIKNSEYKFTLASGGSKTLTLPTTARYKLVQDSVPSGYQNTVNGTTESNSMPSGNVKVAFTNTQMLTLKITNKVNDGKGTFTYQVKLGNSSQTVTLPNNGNWSYTINNIPYGTSYSVKQTENPAYITTPESYEVKGDLKANAEAIFNNTRRMLKLKVKNEVLGGLANQNKEYSFAVIINGEKQTVTLKANTSLEIGEYPYGTSYSVVQEDYSAQGITTENGVTEGKLESAADTVEVTVTNTQETSVLKVINDLSGNDAPFSYTVRVKYADESDFPLAETDSTFTLGADGVKEITIPKNATYTIEQTGPEGYRYETASNTAEGNVGDGATVTFENTQLLTLTIINNVVGEDNTIQYKVSVNDGEPTVLTLANNTRGNVDVPFGSKYTIEQVLPEGYTFNVATVGDTSAEGMTESKEVTFNNVQLVKLTLKAEIDGNMANEEQVFAFSVALGEDTQTVELKGGESKEFEVSYGTSYSVTQTAVEGYVTSINDVEQEEAGTYTASGTLESDTTVTFLNEKSFAIPTGMSMAVLPFLGMVLFGGGIGITQLLGGRKSRRGRYLDR